MRISEHLVSSAARVLAVLAVTAATALTPAPAVAQPPAEAKAAFDRLKSLVGTWDAIDKARPDVPEVVTYTTTGRDSVLVEAFQAASSGTGHMLTAYHLDGDRLVLTHFCGARNQPRMRATRVEDGGRQIAFAMYDITNLASPDAYHSTHVEVEFLGPDRVDLVYRGTQAGKPVTQVFQLTRRQIRSR
jgi:hypothetical protein